MLDTHLLNMSLAVLGIGSGAAILIAAAIVMGAFIWQHRTAARTSVPSRQATSPEIKRHEPARREPALR